MAATEKVWVNNSTTTCDDEDLNGFKNENNNLILGSGLSLNTGDLQQTHKAVCQYSADGDFLNDSGAADAYVLGALLEKLAPHSYTDGLLVRFVASNVNTGASTVNVASLGVKDIKLAGGSDPAAGQVSGQVTLIFDLANDRFELSQSGMGVIRTITVSDAALAYTSGAKLAIVTAIGAGGGGGGADGQGGVTGVNSSAGAGGGWSKKLVLNPSGTINITIGAGGVGGSGGGGMSGSTGGATTVVGTGINITANAGTGGGGMVGTSGSSVPGSSVGGIGSGGDVNGNGTPGGRGRVISGEPIGTDYSGCSVIIGGGKQSSNASGGLNGTVSGAGGGGVFSSLISTDFKGGDGFRGEVVVEEFF